MNFDTNDQFVGLLGRQLLRSNQGEPTAGRREGATNEPNDAIARVINAYRNSSSTQGPSQIPGEASLIKRFLSTQDAKETLKSQLLVGAAAPGASTRDVRSQKTPATSSPSPKKGEKAKRSQEKEALDPKQRRGTVPCRARRMPEEHNFETAVFVLHKNMKHGEHLICSDAACRDEGVKFVYCSLCGIPVAKRNFKSRHDHARHQLDPGSRVHEGGDSKQIKKRSHASGENSKSKHSKKRRKRDHAGQLPTATANFPRDKASTANVVEPGPSRRKETKSKAPDVSADKGLTPSRRSFYWTQLLEIRPEGSNGEALGLWMDLAVLVTNSRVSERQILKSFDNLLSSVKGDRKRSRADAESSLGRGSSLSDFSSEISSSTQE